jgi:tRNA pseudouridine55 synthase
LIALERTRIGDVTLEKCMSPEDIDSFLDEHICVEDEILNEEK